MVKGMEGYELGHKYFYVAIGVKGQRQLDFVRTVVRILKMECYTIGEC